MLLGFLFVCLFLLFLVHALPLWDPFFSGPTLTDFSPSLQIAEILELEINSFMLAQLYGSRYIVVLLGLSHLSMSECMTFPESLI